MDDRRDGAGFVFVEEIRRSQGRGCGGDALAAGLVTGHAVGVEDIRAPLDALGLVCGGGERFALVRHHLRGAAFGQIDAVIALPGIHQRITLPLHLEYAERAFVESAGQRVIDKNQAAGHLAFEFDDGRATRRHQGGLHVPVDRACPALDINLVENLADGVE